MKQQAERDYLHNQVETLKNDNKQLMSRVDLGADGDNNHASGVYDLNQTITAAGSDRSNIEIKD